MKKRIGFTQEELDLITELIAETRKPNGSRKHRLCEDILEKIKKHVNNHIWNLLVADIDTNGERKYD